MQLNSYKIEVYKPLPVPDHRCPSKAIQVEGEGHDKYLHCLICSWIFYQFPPELPDPARRIELKVLNERTYGTFICEYCGKEQVKNTPTKRFCNRKCREAKKRER